jgi:dTDP-4-dehydrorhamnose reductase
MKIIVGATSKLACLLVEELIKTDDQVLSLNRNQTDRWLDCPESLPLTKDVVVINCAAKTNTRFCEDQRGQAYKDNVDLAERIAKICRIKKYENIYISSEVVFGCNELAHRPGEDESPAPLTWYGITKRMGELVTLSNGGLVLRLPILVNLDDHSTIFGKLLNNLQTGNVIQASKYCHSTPVTYSDAVAGITGLIDSRRYRYEKVLHLTGDRYVSIFEMFCLIAVQRGLDQALIHPLVHGPDETKLLLQYGGLRSEKIPPIQSSIYT